MANEITFGYLSGKALTYGAYQPGGTVRTAAGTSLSEVGTTGYYVASDAAIQAYDFVIVKEGSTVVGQGQYQPDVTAVGLAAIGVNVDTLVARGGTINNVYNETGNTAGSVPVITYT